jgi:hypothetical protein
MASTIFPRARQARRDEAAAQVQGDAAAEAAEEPIVTVPLAGGVLDAGQSVTITLTFTGTGGRPHYKARVLSGPGVR